MKHYKLQEIPEEHVTDLFARRFFTGEKATVAFLNMKEGCVVPEHHHESEQFSYIITGAMRFIIGGEEILVRGGEMVQIPSNVLHSAVAIEMTTGIDFFSPIREDWVNGTDDYLRRGGLAG
jgi:quercetin dioxygenase-like cupin family protein